MRTSASAEVTELLLAWNAGDDQALAQLTPLVYRELHRLAHHYMAGERTGHSLQTSALVNEAYIKLVDIRRVQWKGRTHFFAMSAHLMRRILVDFARRRHNLKRGGGVLPITLHEESAVSPGHTSELIAIDEALKALEVVDARKARVVELRFFAGLSAKETAEVLKVSLDTVTRDWRMAKVWLQRELSKESSRNTVT